MIARPWLLLLVLALACSPRLLPGTEIRDTAETRAIAGALEAYRQGIENRDPQAVMALVAPDYFDNSGTPEPTDDVDRDGLAKRLEDELKKVTSVRMQLTLRDIQVKGDRATVEVMFDQYYRVTTPNGSVPRHDADVHQMALKRFGKDWKFTSGL